MTPVPQRRRPDGPPTDAARHGRAWRVLWLALCFVASLDAWRGASAMAFDEYQVKAAYLFNFAKFVEWPAASFATTDAPLVIGVYGADPFGPALDTLVRDKRIGGRPLQIRRSVRMQDLRSSHIVFVGQSTEPLSTSLQQLAGASVLTVGQAEGFLAEGGIILFEIADGRVVFTIHADAASRANLVVSSQLLRLARVNSARRP